jgi:hypothetical protein
MSQVAISGDRGPAKIEARLYPSDTPLYRTLVPNNSERKLVEVIE